MSQFAITEELYDLFSLSSGVNTDTRSITADQLFIALKGERFNGNLYADEALNKGALYAIVDEEKYVTSNQHILVEDGLTALQELAKFHRSTLDIPIIGLTGSNGKTTTKELIHNVLSMTYECFATKGNLNNHIGVPLSILSITPSDEIAVIEMGANHLKEIEFLCTIAQPSFGLITNIGLAHIEGFGSKENIKIGKGELYQYISNSTENKQVFIHEDDPLLMGMAEKLNKIGYGVDSPTSGKIIESNPYIKVVIQDEEQEFTIQTQLIGEYNLPNILAASAVGRHFGVPLLDVAEAIEEYKPTNNRSQLVKKESYSVIMDAYNANPTSMEHALRNFSSLENGSKLAILGDMLELGESSAEEHEKIVLLCKNLNLETTFIGPLFKTSALHHEMKWFSSVDEALPWFEGIDNKSLLLIKGSRGLQLERLINM